MERKREKGNQVHEVQQLPYLRQFRRVSFLKLLFGNNFECIGSCKNENNPKNTFTQIHLLLTFYSIIINFSQTYIHLNIYICMSVYMQTYIYKCFSEPYENYMYCGPLSLNRSTCIS